ncbi:hypothetical protein [uncultured Thiocystis sp.]|jgi:hypothetical protein|uniref:hypothetical protein n=1 Tax=uncultured Thiocystis sp. TaxID=1202134 RepID=UPI0025CC408A|nr:hypothetical protein [uncultured Thiocystis sp.]
MLGIIAHQGMPLADPPSALDAPKPDAALVEQLVGIRGQFDALRLLGSQQDARETAAILAETAHRWRRLAKRIGHTARRPAHLPRSAPAISN